MCCQVSLTRNYDDEVISQTDDTFMQKTRDLLRTKCALQRDECAVFDLPTLRNFLKTYQNEDPCEDKLLELVKVELRIRSLTKTTI